MHFQWQGPNTTVTRPKDASQRPPYWQYWREIAYFRLWPLFSLICFAFGPTGNSTIRSADHENPTLEPNKVDHMTLCGDIAIRNFLNEISIQVWRFLAQQNTGGSVLPNLDSHSILQIPSSSANINNTRKQCYRKDDRAMRPTYVSTATFPKILWAFVSMVPSESSYRRVPIGPPIHTYYSSISNRLPKILDCSFEWKLRTPNFWEGRP